MTKSCIRWLGFTCSRRPYQVLGGWLAFFLLLSPALRRVHIETDPVKLWSRSNSEATLARAKYEDAFGRFYRVEQLILRSTAPSGAAAAAVVTDANIRLVFDILDLVNGLTVARRDSGGDDSEEEGEGEAPGPPIGLEDVCYRPLAGGPCLIESVAGYWKNDRDLYVNGLPPYGDRLTPAYCLSHWTTQCRTDIGAPLDPHLVLGGFDPATPLADLPRAASALVLTFLVRNPAPGAEPEGRLLPSILAWERALVQLAEQSLRPLAAAHGLSLSYSVETAVPDELARETGMERKTVLVSYLFMLLYVALARSRSPSSWKALLTKPWRIVFYSRFLLGLSAVMLAGLSSAAAVALCNFCGVAQSLISLEVLPFLVLAIAVDNVFLLSIAVDADTRGLLVEDRVTAALEATGPSILSAGASETLAFFLAGVFAPMPAVSAFALTASVALLIALLAQLTAFVSVLTLDAQRIQVRGGCAGGYDVQFWPRVSCTST